MKKNELVKKNKYTTSSYLRGKSNKYKKLYCKLNNIDTVIMDTEFYFNVNNIYNNNKYLKNIIIDLNNPENYVHIDLNNVTTIENISYLNYPKLDGITIPLDILNERLGLYIFVSPDRTNIKKINILNQDKNEVIDIDDNISYYLIEKIIENGEYKLKIKLGYINDDKKNFYFDKLGNKTITYEQFSIESEVNIDLREYKNSNIIKFPKKEYYEETNKFIITPSILKEKELQYFTNIFINNFILISDNEMEINPIKLELNNITLDIINVNDNHNIIYIMDKNYKEYYIYIDENNKLNIIDSNKLDNNKLIEKYKYLQNESYNISGVIVKYKKDLKFDLYINNKLYHLNKIFINWYLNNTTQYDKKIIPSYYKHKENIYDIDKDDYKEIGEYIYNDLLEEILEHNLFDNFNKLYNDYLIYWNNIVNLHDLGYSNKAIVYLHKNSFDNITGIKGKYRKFEDKGFIDAINETSKKLIKRK